MRHPLINPSLTPHGFGVGNAYTRTAWKSSHGSLNGDWAAARFWQEANRLSSGYRPAEHIVHEIMPGMRTVGRTEAGDFMFDGRPYREHDLAVMTRVAIWLGCSCGQGMLKNNMWGSPKYTKTNEYRVRWRYNEQPQREGFMLRMLLHECRKDTCWPVRGLQSCDYSHTPWPTERETLVLDAFLFWLGTEPGRTYLSRFDQFVTKTAHNVYQGYKASNTPAKRREQFLARVANKQKSA